MDIYDQNISQAVKSAVMEFDGSAKVVMFGSRARRDARNESDYDFLVLLNVPFDYKLKSKILDRLYEVELAYNCVIGALIEHREQWKMLEHTPIFSEIEQDGIAV